MHDFERSQFFRTTGVRADRFASFEQAQKAWDAFLAQRHRAKQRNIGWEMTFAEWWQLWCESGHWDQRGRAHIGVYVMGRYGDAGPYKVGNVQIITHSQNISDSWKNVDRGVVKDERGQFRRQVAQ
jgi:hypothetical protein